MKQILIHRYGVPEDVADCAEVPDVGAPEQGEVVFEVLAFPINPADIWLCRGNYRLQPPLPATPGAECVGRVLSVGSNVKGIAPGDRVINLQRENWAQRRRVPAGDVIKVPAALDVRQASMLRINPPTALLLLSDVATLQPGDWIIQNAANSAVGRILIRLAHRRGVKTVNIIRRESLSAELEALGADVCLVDGPGLSERAAQRTGGASIRLGLDAVSGQGTARMSECIADEGVICNYGTMTGEDPSLPRAALIFRGVSLTGFMLGRALARRPPDAVRALYSDLAGELLAGILSAPVEAVYPIEEIKSALRHAQQSGRSGKILVAPNGMV